MFSVSAGATMKIMSSDKKGNVLYVRLHITFPSDNKDPTKKKRNIVLDLEFFFIGTSTGGVLVRTGVPSINFQTDAYAWTQAWLTSLRVPID